MFSISCPVGTREAAQREAGRRGISTSAYIRELIAVDLDLPLSTVYRRQRENSRQYGRGGRRYV